MMTIAHSNDVQAVNNSITKRKRAVQDINADSHGSDMDERLRKLLQEAFVLKFYFSFCLHVKAVTLLIKGFMGFAETVAQYSRASTAFNTQKSQNIYSLLVVFLDFKW